MSGGSGSRPDRRATRRNRAVVCVRRLLFSSSGERVPAARALKQPEVRLESLVAEGQVRLDLDDDSRDIDLASIETEFKYQGYVRRQEAAVERQRRQEDRLIPRDFEFAGIPGLSRESVERLSSVRPGTLGQALRIPGMTPAAVAVLAAYLDRPRSRAAV